MEEREEEADSLSPRRILMVDENLEAMGAFLEYLYKDEYTPRKSVDGGLEGISKTATTDEEGESLLKHARIYTLANKLEMSGLKVLAHSKVHRINATAKAEIAYARYVYAHTPRDDVTIRKPIASFWGQRSHVLRHEAEDDFKKLCLDHPDFAFDVLSHVLDAREKKKGGRDDADDGVTVPKSGRKRARNQ